MKRNLYRDTLRDFELRHAHGRRWSGAVDRCGTGGVVVVDHRGLEALDFGNVLRVWIQVFGKLARKVCPL